MLLEENMSEYNKMSIDELQALAIFSKVSILAGGVLEVLSRRWTCL